MLYKSVFTYLVLYSGDKYFVMLDVCSERGLGFSGYKDDENEIFSAATSSNDTELATHRHQMSSDINRNPLETTQRPGVDSNKSASAQLPSMRVDTQARERRDGKNIDDRRDTLPQVTGVEFLPVHRLKTHGSIHA